MKDDGLLDRTKLNMKRFRKDSGLSVEQVARHLDISSVRLGAYEDDPYYDVPLYHLTRLADLYGRELADFFEPSDIDNPTRMNLKGIVEKIDLAAISKFRTIVKAYIKMIRVEKER